MKQFCKYGHDTFSYGRGKNGGCKVCAREYNRKWQKVNQKKSNMYFKKLKEKMVQLIKELKRKPCTDCGNCFEPYQMDFDHLKNKKYNIAEIPGQCGTKGVLAEIAKCDLVCANCHRKRTYLRMIR